MKLLSQVLILYYWGAGCVLLFFLFAIARFFEQRRVEKTAPSGKRVYYSLFLPTILLFGASAVLYALSEPLAVGNWMADILRVLGSIVLGFTGFSLLNTMMGGRP